MKIFSSLVLGSVLMVSAQADYLMKLTDKDGIEENICVKSYSFSNNVTSFFKEKKQKNNLYSLDEQLTNNKWLDGKPIYRKTVKILGASIADKKWRWSSYENPPSNVERLIKTELIMKDISGYSGWPTSNYSVRYELRGNAIGYALGPKMKNLFTNQYVLLEYTKTTDTPNMSENEITTLVHYLPSSSTTGEYITKSTKNLQIGFFENYVYDSSTDSCTQN